MKMSDVFGVSCNSVVAESFGQYLVVNEVDTARFKNRKHTGAVAHAINNHDRLTKENADLKADRDNAISKMSKSWQHNADDYPDLLSKFVDMANRQFDERDELTKENAELREFLESLQLDVSNEIKLEQLLNKTEQ